MNKQFDRIRTKECHLNIALDLVVLCFGDFVSDRY